VATGAQFNDIVQTRGAALAAEKMKACRDFCAAKVADLLGVSPVPAPGGYTEEMQQVFRIFGSDQPTKVPGFVVSRYTDKFRADLLAALTVWIQENP